VKAEIVGRVAVTTTLSAGAGGISALIFQYCRTKMWNLIDVCNGLLCGLVSITAGCAVLEPWAAIIAGACGALIFFSAVEGIRKFRIDDPLEAAPMHGACGMWGVLVTGLLATKPYTTQVYGEAVAAAGYGAFYPGGGGNLLACQVIAVLCIAAWTVGLMGPFFYAFRLAGILRVSASEEMVGLDMSKHGGCAYYTDRQPGATEGGSKHEITIVDNLGEGDELKAASPQI
jgi:Amt family ammonium transporter